MSFLNHLQHENSIIIDAIEKGKWVFLDGIELAQLELFERISSLCDINNPRLNLFEKGPSYEYSKTPQNPKYKIHHNFRLFFSYNPYDAETNKKISQGFLNKCAVFTLYPLDEDLKSSSLVLSGLFQNAENSIDDSNSKKIVFFKENNQKIAAKLENVHFEAKKICKNNLDKFSNKDFSERTLKFIYNSLINRDNYEEQIISAIEDCYSIAYINPKPLTNHLLKEFEKRTFIKTNSIFKKR